MRTRLSILLATILAVLSLPAFLYSIETPFALIDDYSDWNFVRITDSWANLWHYIDHTWIHFFHPDRYRPLYDLQHWLTWSLFGTHYSLHHAFRWLVKLAVVLFAWGVFRKTFDGSRTTARKTGGQPGFWLFLFLYWFAPNNPEARLAPQELNTVFTTAMFTYFLVRWTQRRSGWVYLGLLAAYVGISMSKENTLGILIAGVLTLGWVLGKSTDRLGRLKQAVLWLAPFASVLGYTIFRVQTARVHGVHGSAPLELKTLLATLPAVAKYSLFWQYAGIGGALALLAWIGLPKEKDRPRPGLFPPAPLLAFVGLAYCGTVGILGLQGYMVLRYPYPLVFLGALGIGLFFQYLIDASIQNERQARRLRLAGAALAAIFVLHHYHNYLYQFATQHRARNSEKLLLERIRAEIGDSGTVIVKSESEEGSKIASYFGQFLPRFESTQTRAVFYPEAPPEARLLVSHESDAPAGWTQAEVVHPIPHQYRALTFAGRISRLFRHPREVFAWVDSGATYLEYRPWFLFHRSSPQ